MPKNVIFDLDGTLADSVHDIGSCVSQAYENVIGRKDIVFTKENLGAPIMSIIRDLSPGIEDGQADAIASEYRRLYSLSLLPKTSAYPGMVGLLDRLKSSGCRLFIVTNKGKSGANRVVEMLGMSHFDAIITPDYVSGTHFQSKTDMLRYLLQLRNISPDDAIMVGDSDFDIRAAKEAGIKSIFVSYGYGSKEKLVPPPDFIAHSAEKIWEIIQSLHS